MPHLFPALPLAGSALACFVAIAAVVGSNEDRGNPSHSEYAFSTVVQHLQKSNIETWAGGRSGTNRWVGSFEGRSMPVIDVVVPAPQSDAEAGIAESAHASIVEVNRHLGGLLLLRDLAAPAASNRPRIQVSYQTAYVPPTVIDDRAWCSRVSAAPGEPARFRPGADGRRDHGIAWLDLGNGHCRVDEAEALRQLAVALGLDAPFPGFDTQSREGGSALWDALITLYANPVGTAATALRPAETAHDDAGAQEPPDPALQFVNGS